MNLPAHSPLISAEEYLHGESLAEVRHEYVGGQVFAMAGADERHNRIALNFAFHLRAAARKGPCGVFISDMKVRVRENDAYYYPDVLLTCDQNDQEALYKTAPCLIVEVLSPTTETIDRREKLAAYRTLPSLRYYILAEQDQRRIEVFWRGEDGEWRHELLMSEGLIELDCGELNTALTLEDIYEDVRL